jgi:hypothetical protein
MDEGTGITQQQGQYTNHATASSASASAYSSQATTSISNGAIAVKEETLPTTLHSSSVLAKRERKVESDHPGPHRSKKTATSASSAEPEIIDLT